MYYVGFVKKLDGRIYMYVYIDVYIFIRTIGISYWFSLFVFIVEIWGLVVNWSRWKEDKLKRVVEEAVMGNFVYVF